MRKIFIIIAAMFVCMSSAQEALGQNKKGQAEHSDWFFSLAAGAQTYWGENDGEAGFSKRITPAFDLSFGRWLNHIWGVRLQYNGFGVKGATSANNVYADDVISGSTYKQSFDYMNLHVDLMFNLNSAVCYYHRRFYEIIPYVGVGYARAYKDSCPSENSLSINGGLLNKFRLGRSFDLNLDLRAMLVKESFENEKGGFPLEGVTAATLGVTYRF